MSWIGIVLIGLLGGIASGFFGVGGGVIFVPLLVLFRRMDIHTAIGTSLAVIVPTALAAALRNTSAGTVDWKIVLPVTLFAIAGAWAGSNFSLRLDALLLKRIFAFFLLVMAARLFFTRS